MQILVNGEPHDLLEGLTLRALVDHLGLGGGPVAVELNQQVVPRAEHASTVLSDGDRVEIVHFVGGG